MPSAVLDSESKQRLRLCTLLYRVEGLDEEMCMEQIITRKVVIDIVKKK